MTGQRVTCPDCQGAGDWVTITELYWNGNQRERLERCDRCSGAGWIYIDELTPAETRDMLESKQEY